MNISLLQSLHCLVPSSPSFLHVPSLLPFINHYDINVESITAEAAVAINFLKEASLLSSIHHVYIHLYECFPDTLMALQIAMTIGITTASAEKSFSSLRRLKSYLRSTMSQERLYHLSLLHIERDLSSKLWDHIDELVIQFADTHKNSRLLQ